MLRIGMVGIGGLGQMHLRNYLKFDDVEVVALADLDKNLREGKFADIEVNLGKPDESVKIGAVRSYADYHEMYADDDIDVVSICLPTDLHAGAAITALEAGKNVFCEKPIAITVEQGRHMLDAAVANHKTLMIGHSLRFKADYLAVERILQSGIYGKVLAASFARCGAAPGWGSGNWFSSPKRSGGAVVDLHIHDADLCVWWWGKPADISAGGAFVGDSPNILHSRWRYENGPAVQFETSWDPTGTVPFYYGFRIIFEKATAIFDSRTSKGIELFTETESGKNILEDMEQTHHLELEDRYFLDCVSQNRFPDRCPPAESLLALECVIEEARQLKRLCQER